MNNIDQFLELHQLPVGHLPPQILPDVAVILRLQYANAIAGSTYTLANCPEALRDEFRRIITQAIRVRDLRALPNQDFKMPKNSILI